MDVEPLMNVLERFYQEYSAPETDYFREYGKGVFPIPKERVEEIFSPRLELFRMKLSRLRQLFNDPFEVVEEGDKRVQGFIRSLEPELSQFIMIRTTRKGRRSSIEPSRRRCFIRRREECALGLESLRIGKKKEEVTQKESNARYPSS